MLFSWDEVRDLGARVWNTAGQVPPPPVMRAMLALVPDGKLDHVVGSCQRSAEDGTRWHIVGSAGQALLTIDASSPDPDWMNDNPDLGHGLADGEQVDARLVRIDDVASTDLVGTRVAETIGKLVFSGRWQLAMRDGTQVAVPASRNHPDARQACDALAHHLAGAMRRGSIAELETSTDTTSS